MYGSLQAFWVLAGLLAWEVLKAGWVALLDALEGLSHRAAGVVLGTAAAAAIGIVGAVRLARRTRTTQLEPSGGPRETPE